MVFLPSIPWSASLFQRPHHLARFFARQGYVAVYDCDCAGPVQDEVSGFREIEPNLYLYRGPRQLLTELPEATLWAFPYNYGAVDAYPAKFRIVYDWIDSLEIFYHRGRELIHGNHARAMGEATVVAAVTRTLHARALLTRPDALYLPNAVDYEHFADAATAIPDDPEILRLRQEGKPIAGYYGAVASWFDYPLFEELALRRPDWNFLLIGPLYEKDTENKLPTGLANVTWIGPRDYRALPGYLQLFDVALIPFQINEITQATSPLKLYEFFAGGKPVVSSPLPECEAYGKVRVARTAGEFANALDAALADSCDDACRERIRAVGRRNSWGSRVQAVADVLRQNPVAPRPRSDLAGKGIHAAASPGRSNGRPSRSSALSGALWDIRRIAARTLPADTRRGRCVRSLARRMRNVPGLRHHRGEPGMTLSRILRDNADREGIVISPPFIDWTWMRQRPHQLMAEFARAGYLSLYCSPRKWTDSFTGFSRVADRLYLCESVELVLGISNPVLLIGWTGHLETAKRFQRPFVIYDYLDNLSVSSEGGKPSKRKLDMHRTLVDESAVVLATARQLYDEVRGRRPDVLYCPNGVDYGHFHLSASPPVPVDIADLVASGRPIIGYYGALAHWFDYELVAHAAAARGDCTFLLIGPDFDGTLAASHLTRLPNVRWLSEKKYEELPSYLHYFTVATIPFLVNDVTRATSPVKLFEYMAGERPIVTTDMPECSRYPCVLAAGDREDFVEKLDEAIRLGKQESYGLLLDEEAINNTWETRVGQIIARINALDGRSIAYGAVASRS